MDYKAKAIAGLLAATCVFTIIALILSVVNVRDVLLPPSTKYGLVFDAGSTHTTLYVYQWPGDKENGTGIVSQVEACTVPGPGISSYADDPAGAGASLKPCLDKAMEIIPAEQQQETPTYLGATAGMRLLSCGSCWQPRPSPANSSCCPQGSRSPQQVSHPCYPKGYQENITMADLYNSPCVQAPSSPSPVQNLTVTGTGDPAACAIAIRELFNFSCEASRTCGFNGVYQPPVRGQFFAFAGFYYTFHFLNLTNQQSLNDVNSTVQTFCKKNWTELVQTFPQDKRHLHNYCSTGIYILTLLLDGYKFTQQTWSSIHFSQQAGSMDIGWSLGFMLNFTNMIPMEAVEHVKGHQPSLWAGAVSFIVLTIVVALVAVFLQCSGKPRSSQRPD
ncbi:PREDICTED: ectonucleoside triphosphate diphosphohydrolase 8-like [Chaetura pelagica]|uniref:ectonucleoside triphosphate diphosphohydrolase 8-like n=1 Tax=Chaetura pelagica TaxID=8897 RepID=UPI0005234A1B|nr:PREDICTED: ectonucleoside triphosphate diphosphohydrolase 8-like [Chaetura pelagica]